MINFTMQIHWRYVISTAFKGCMIIVLLVVLLFMLQFFTDNGILPIDHCKEAGLDPATSACESAL